MSFDPNHFPPPLLTATIIGAILIILKLRDHLTEKPDPKLTYATIKQLNQLQHQLNSHEKHTNKNFNILRQEIKNDIQNLSSNHHNATNHLNQLINHSLQETSALSAQANITIARISELSTKTDKLLSK